MILLINLVYFFIKLITFIACSLKDSRNFFRQSLPLYKLCFFPTLLNDDIVNIDKPDGTSSLTFHEYEFSGSFLHPSIFSIKYSRSG